MSLKALLMDKLPNYNKIVVPYHLIKSIIATRKYDLPSKKMRVIGVTGTNGKTSTCFMIWKMLNEAGHKAGLMTTVAYGTQRLEKQIEHMTTVDVLTLNERMQKIAENGAEFLVLEVTSHALAQYRTYGIKFEIAVLTNVTHEHLDYHKTFENYRDAKRRLFKKANFGIINGDDESAIYFANDVKEYITYGIKKGMLQAKKIELGTRGVEYEVEIDRSIGGRRQAGTNRSIGGKCQIEANRLIEEDDVLRKQLKYEKQSKKMKNGASEISEIRIKTQIPGKFTVYNSLAAVAVGVKLGLSDKQIQKGILALDVIEGRMNRIDKGQDFEVIVDYAHTPDAFLKVFESIEVKKGGRVIALFGGAGRRDESTRAERGEIAAKNADIVIITEDDSRDEDKKMIAEDFLEGVKRQKKKKKIDLFVELDRRKAIEKAIMMAKKDDIVLILGKGHEKTILRAEGAMPFEDFKVVEEVLVDRLKK